MLFFYIIQFLKFKFFFFWQSAKLRKLPPFLTISLLRFNFDFVKCERYKETSCYTFPLRINLKPFCEQVWTILFWNSFFFRVGLVCSLLSAQPLSLGAVKTYVLSCSVVADAVVPKTSLPGSSVRGVCQARILEWVAMPSSRGSSWSRDQTSILYVACVGSWILYHCTTWEAPITLKVA